jgi:hypothetical protein
LKFSNPLFNIKRRQDECRGKSWRPSLLVEYELEFMKLRNQDSSDILDEIPSLFVDEAERRESWSDAELSHYR